MANRVTMNICGQEYVLVAEESAGYMDEASRAKNEASELKRQLFKLQNQQRG